MAEKKRSHGMLTMEEVYKKSAARARAQADQPPAGDRLSGAELIAHCWGEDWRESSTVLQPEPEVRRWHR